ncbi:cytochrome b [Labrys monachus]|uniref:Cytochrome b561 n=1 Tax=Labrys monachus TaxID=217067 RepID=A0ABU0F715_9HYPH|nr:cytochrome b [Labrys monachus]MDQ0390226.1 cytochrome b561 [Labrys monachus]
MSTLPIPSPRYGYDRLQRGFHWLMAALIFAAIGLGVWSAWLVQGTPLRRGLLDIHKSLGMTVLALIGLRILYRLVAGEPAFRVPPGRLAHLAAKAGHAGLYVLMLFMPLTGYLTSASGGNTLPWFGLFSWPNLLPRDKANAMLGAGLHYGGAWTLGAVLALHLLAVAWHVFVRRDEVLARMIGTR